MANGMPTEIGYCRRCMRNSVHLGSDNPGLFALVDSIFFGILRRLRFGDWRCMDCQTQSKFLRPVNSSPPEPKPIESNPKPVESKPKPMESNPRSKETAEAKSTFASLGSQLDTPEVVSASRLDTERTAAEQSSAGNFLRNDQSLIMQSVRSDRFTEKFRDGVVQRILDGKTTIAEVRDKHYLTEQDVIAWIKASFDRKQKRVDELTLQLRLVHGDAHHNNDGILKIEEEPQRVTVEVIDVQPIKRTQ